MGGNVQVNGYKAQKIPVKEIGLKKFQNDFKKLFYELDNLFYKQNKEHIWKTKNIIDNSYVFNGSTSFLMQNDISPDVLDLKPSAGDIDIMVPEDLKEKLWNFLKSIEGKQIGNFTYIGNNKPTVSSIGEQINALFKYCYKKDKCVYAQTDFEFVPFEEKEGDSGDSEFVPSEWSKFSHSSTFTDLQAGVKSLAHKYLIRSVAYATSYMNNAIFVTFAANCENWEKKISKTKNTDNHLLKFSVSRGIRVAYEPLICNDEQVIKDGKFVFRKLKTDESIYHTDIEDIFEMIFGVKPSKDEKSKFWSFVGLTYLMKKYLDKKQINMSFERFLDLLWDNKSGKNIAQELERDNPELDYQIKIGAVNYLLKNFSYLKSDYEKYLNKIDAYYKNYGIRESLIESILNNIKFKEKLLEDLV